MIYLCEFNEHYGQMKKVKSTYKYKNRATKSIKIQIKHLRLCEITYFNKQKCSRLMILGQN